MDANKKNTDAMKEGIGDDLGAERGDSDDIAKETEENMPMNNSSIRRVNTTNTIDEVVLDVDEEGKKIIDNDSQIPPQTPNNADGDQLLLRGWDKNTTPNSPIDYSNMEDTPYEHGFESGDHIIRWDMLPILWPIQIHGIVLEVSEDKSEVTICDFGITSVKNEEKKINGCKDEQPEKIVEDENAIFTEAIKDDDHTAVEKDCDGEEGDDNDKAESIDDESSTNKKDDKKKKRLNVIKLTKWSDLRKWSKVNYDKGLFGGAAGKENKMGKELKKLGKKTEQLWSSMAKSLSLVRPNADDDATNERKVVSVRYDVDDRGYCVHHPDIQLKRWVDEDEDWAIVRKKCPECIKEDCPIMMGGESSDSAEGSYSSTDSDEYSASQTSASNTATEDDGKPAAESVSADDMKQPSSTDESQNEVSNSNGASVTDVTKADEQKTLEQMIAEANEVEKRSRIVAKSPEKSPEKSSMGEKKKSWHGSFMKSVSNLFPQKNENDDKATKSEEDDTLEETEPENKHKTWKDIPRSDPPKLVIARTRVSRELSLLFLCSS